MKCFCTNIILICRWRQNHNSRDPEGDQPRHEGRGLLGRRDPHQLRRQLHLHPPQRQNQRQELSGENWASWSTSLNFSLVPVAATPSPQNTFHCNQ